MMTRDYELIDSIEMLEKAIQRMDIAENGYTAVLCCQGTYGLKKQRIKGNLP